VTWIRIIPNDDSAGPDLRSLYESVSALYPPEYDGEPVPSLVRPDGDCDSIVAAHSLIPEAMRHMMSGLGVLLAPHLPLARRQHEMIAAVVSAENRCFY
jgi:hypothetical protein